MEKCDKRNGFTFFLNFEETICELDESMQVQMYRAIVRFGLYHEKPDFGGVLKALWVQIEPQLERQWSFYRNGKKGAEFGHLGAEHGKLGGNPNFKKGKRNPYYPQDNPQDNPNITPPQPPNKILGIGYKILDTSIVESNDAMSTGVDADAEISVVEEARNDVVDYKRLMDFFNTVMQGKAISQISRMTERRKQMVSARCREYGKSAIQRVFENAAASSFLNGGGGGGFVASFDWLIRPNNFPKVLEGNYADRSSPRQQTKEHDKQSRLNEAAMRIARLRASDMAQATEFSEI